jgi:hypothetical protein
MTFGPNLEMCLRFGAITLLTLFILKGRATWNVDESLFSPQIGITSVESVESLVMEIDAMVLTYIYFFGGWV